MVTTKEAGDAVCRHLGFDPPRVRAVAKLLTEDGVLPSGGPGRSPQLDVEHVISLVVACALDVPLRAVADSVRQYFALIPGGASLDGAPAAIDKTAGDAIAIWADIAIHGDSVLLRRDKIEVVSNWQEVAIHDSTTGRTHRFVPAGTDASYWQTAGHRRSTVIAGAALVDALRSLFTKE